MHIAFPFSVAPDGRSRLADRPAHLRQLIEQILFTSPGERVMRPEFGTHLRKILFAPLSTESAAAVETMVQAALQQHLAQEIAVVSVKAESRESELHVAVEFTDRRDGEKRREEYVGGVP